MGLSAGWAASVDVPSNTYLIGDIGKPNAESKPCQDDQISKDLSAGVNPHRPAKSEKANGESTDGKQDDERK